MSLFGQTNTASGAQQTPNAFSNTTNNAQAGSAFGGGGSLFGSKPPSGGLSGGSLFPSANNSANTNTGATNTGGSLFGRLGGAVNPLTSGGASGTNPLMGGNATGSGLFPGTSSTTNSLGGNAATPAGTIPGSTGSLGGLFGNKPADQGATKATPAPSNFFTPPTTANLGAAGPSTGPTTSLPGGSLFPKKADGPASTSTPAPAIAPLSAFSLPGSTAGAAKPATTGTGSGLTGGLFGNLNSNKDKPEEKKDGAASAPLFGTLGGAGASTSTSTEKKDAPAPLGSLGAGLGTDKNKATTPSASSLPALNTSSAISVPPPSMLRGKSIEEIVNRWSTELENHVREFTKFSAEVTVWDRALIENGNNLAALYSHVRAAEQEQNDIDQSLDHIEQQQRDLSTTLEIYEKQMEDILGGQGGGLRTLDTGPADTERDKNYMLATELHSHLDDLSSSLTQLVEAANAVSLMPATDTTTPTASENSMMQIAQVLSSHLESLQWIDGASRELEGKVSEVERKVKESGLGGNGNNGSSGGGRRGYGLNR